MLQVSPWPSFIAIPSLAASVNFFPCHQITRQICSCYRTRCVISSFPQHTHTLFSPLSYLEPFIFYCFVAIVLPRLRTTCSLSTLRLYQDPPPATCHRLPVSATRPHPHRDSSENPRGRHHRQPWQKQRSDQSPPSPFRPGRVPCRPRRD